MDCTACTVAEENDLKFVTAVTPPRHTRHSLNLELGVALVGVCCHLEAVFLQGFEEKKFCPLASLG